MDNFPSTKIVVPIDKLHPNPLNPNYMTPRQFKILKDGIQQMGFVASIIVREYGDYYQILDGEHRFKALKELGYTKAPVENMGPISDEQLPFLTRRFNQGGQEDMFKVGKLDKMMEDSGQTNLLELLQATSEERANTIKLVSFDFAQYEKEAELPERKPGQLIVLPFTVEEAEVWRKTKEELLKRDLITKDNSKKQQDIQTIMWLVKNALGILIGSDGSSVIEYEK